MRATAPGSENVCRPPPTRKVDPVAVTTVSGGASVCFDANLAAQPPARVPRRALGDVTNVYAQAPRSQAGMNHHAGGGCLEKKNEAPAADAANAAIAILDEAVSAVVASVCHGGLDADWTSCLSVKMAELLTSTIAPPELSRVLEAHGWRRTQFVRPPDREMLLLDLDRLRARVTSALPPGLVARAVSSSTTTLPTSLAPTAVPALAAMPLQLPLPVAVAAGHMPMPMPGAGMTTPAMPGGFAWPPVAVESQRSGRTAYLAAPQATTAAYDPRARPGEADLCWARAAPPAVSAALAAFPAPPAAIVPTAFAAGAATGSGRSEAGDSASRPHDSTGEVDSLPASETSAIGIAEEVAEDDWQRVAEYAPEIVRNLRGAEATHLPSPTYMDLQPHINGRMRAILIDWIIDVCVKYELRRGTLFLAVSLIDRYLARASVTRDRLQLVGTAAAMVAAKYEEISPPGVRDFCFVAADIYTATELFSMECAMLNLVGFSLATPTALFFLDYYSMVNGCEPVHRELVQYVAELALVEMQILNYRPSHLAAAAVFVGNKLVGRSTAWPQDMVECAQCEEETIQDCAAWLKSLFEAAPTRQLQAVRRKFSLERHHEVAFLRAPPEASAASPPRQEDAAPAASAAGSGRVVV